MEKEEPKRWRGNTAHMLQIKTLKERSFTLNLSNKEFQPKAILKGIKEILGHTEIDTIQETSYKGSYLIITKDTKDATKLANNPSFLIGKEVQTLVPKVRRSTLLTLPYVDPDISNDDIRNYFQVYGMVRGVSNDYYKEEGMKHIKTGRRLVFLEVEEGYRPPPFAIIKNRKIMVCYKDRHNICFHCNVAGHSKSKCPLKAFKTCYNCGMINHTNDNCYDPAVITYMVNPNIMEVIKDVVVDPKVFMPENYKSDETDQNRYGNITDQADATKYTALWDPVCYTSMSWEAYENYMLPDKQDTPEDEFDDPDGKYDFDSETEMELEETETETKTDTNKPTNPEKQAEKPTENLEKLQEKPPEKPGEKQPDQPTEKPATKEQENPPPKTEDQLTKNKKKENKQSTKRKPTTPTKDTTKKPKESIPTPPPAKTPQVKRALEQEMAQQLKNYQSLVQGNIDAQRRRNKELAKRLRQGSKEWMKSERSRRSRSNSPARDRPDDESGEENLFQ